MAKRPLARRKRKAKRRSTAEAAPVAGPAGTLDALQQQIQADGQLLEELRAADPSPAVWNTIEDLRRRYESTLLRTSELLEQHLHEAQQENAELRAENQTLRETRSQLEYKVARLKLELRKALKVPGPAKGNKKKKDDDTASSGDSDKAKPGDQAEKGDKSKGGQRKRGAPKGHRGATRSVPPSVDSDVFIGPPATCSCGCTSVAPMPEWDTRYVEDIPPIVVHVTRQNYQKGRCTECGKLVHHPDAINRPLVVTGPNLAAHLTMMNQMGVTFRKLSFFSSQTLEIALSPAGAYGIVDRVAEALEGPYAEILEHLRQQGYVNGDETGWKVAGRGGYIWCFCTPLLAYFHHDYRRSAAVIEEILGDSFAGVVVCDFYAAYNCLGKTQRCLVHLLRDIKTERELLGNSALLRKFEDAVKAFIEKGLEAQAMPEGQAKDKAVAEAEKQFDKLTRMKVTKGRGITLVKRMKKYRADLIRFITHPGVEFHNNRAERQLRPIVIHRKVSFGSNTKHGARRYCIVHTIVETCKLQGIDPVDYLRRAYISNGLDVPRLVGADPPAAA